MTETTNKKTEEVTNKIYLSGTITSPFKYDHECKGERFYKFSLRTERRSEIIDEIEAIVSDRILYFCDKQEGDRIGIEGQVRTYNSDNGLKVFVFVKNIFEPGDEDVNEVTATGFICKEVIFRETPFGRKVSDIIFAVNRRFNKSDYIPCICWGRNAKYAATLPVGTQLKIKGRLQSRDYLKRYEDKEAEVKTVNEVSISVLEVI